MLSARITRLGNGIRNPSKLASQDHRESLDVDYTRTSLSRASSAFLGGSAAFLQALEFTALQNKNNYIWLQLQMQLGVFDALLSVKITLEVDHMICMGKGTGVAAELSAQALPV